MNWFQHRKLHKAILSSGSWTWGEVRECWVCGQQWATDFNSTEPRKLPKNREGVNK